MLVSGARECRAPLVSSSRRPRDLPSPPLRCSNPRTRIGGSSSDSGKAPAEWGIGGRNSFFSSSSCWWCSRDSPSARQGFGACLPLGAHSKSQSPPGLPEQVVQGCRGVGEGAGEGCKEWVGHGGCQPSSSSPWGARRAARAVGCPSEWTRRSGSGCCRVSGCLKTW